MTDSRPASHAAQDLTNVTRGLTEPTDPKNAPSAAVVAAADAVVADVRETMDRLYPNASPAGS